jgi:hypothetical protein
MKRGLIVMMVLGLVLTAFSCTSGQGSIVMNAGDNTRTMGAVIQNAGSIHISSAIVTIMTTPTVEELLTAALDVPAISESTKDRINIILDLLPSLDGWRAKVPAETLQAIDAIMSDVEEAGNVTATIGVLQDAVDSGDYDGYEWLPEALDFGIDLLDDGEATIFNPGWSPYEQTPFVGFNVSQLWRASLEGCLTGAVGCALGDDVPDQYAVRIGGVIGAVDSSTADLISQLSDWW